MNRRFDHLASSEAFPPIQGMSASLLRAFTEWRLRQTPPLTPNQALLSLLALALSVEGHLVLGPQIAEPEEDRQIEELAEVMRELHRK